MASETIDGQQITVTADDVQLARQTAIALRRLVADDGASDATIRTANGHSVDVAPFLISALQQLAALLAQGDDVALVPIHRELSPAEAATVLQVSVPFLMGLLDAGDIASTGTGDDRRVHLSDLMAYQGQRSSENRRDLAAALAVAQEAGAYD